VAILSPWPSRLQAGWFVLLRRGGIVVDFSGHVLPFPPIVSSLFYLVTVCWCLLVFAGVCSRLPVFAGVC